MLLVLSLASWALAQQGRYIVALNDGRIVSGDKLTGWHAPGLTVRLDSHVAAAPGKPLRWMRDSYAGPWRVEDCRSGFIEFVGGDRLIGTLIGGKARAWEDGMSVPAHLVVRPASTKRTYTHGSDEETVRVLPDSIRRVVLMPGLRHRFQPGTVFLRDKRRVAFVRIRWGEGSVQLLLKSGASTVSLGDIAEIHMPPPDQWEAYYRQLAVLSPGCRSRLVRFETTEGVVITGSEARFGARPFYSGDVLRQAEHKRKHYSRQLANLKARETQHRAKYERYRKNHEKQIAALEAGIKRHLEAHKKVIDAEAGGLEKQRKADAARYEKERKDLKEDYRKAVAEIEKRIARLPESNRAARRRTYAGSKKRALDRLLATVDRREAANQTKRKYEQAQQARDLATKLKYIASARMKLDAERTRFESSIRGPGYYLDQIEAMQKLLDALPGRDGNAQTWYHMVQPAWSLEPLWVPFKTISMRLSFAPEMVPLSLVSPTKTVSPVMLQWRVDRNIDGGLLRSGTRTAGWGFGVHAYSELSFPLPPEAVSFRSSLGLDRLVDNGGCARARVFIGSTETKPVYESSLLIGSGKTADTGAIPIRYSEDGRRDIVLQVDPAYRNHPPQADPLNIRDKFDWIEPQIVLRADRLREKVGRYAAGDAAAWSGWTVNFDKQGVYEWGSWFDWAARYERGLFQPTISAKGKPLKLSREITIPKSDKWLVVDVGDPSGGAVKASAVTLRVDGQQITAEKTPIRQYWRRRASPLAYSIEKYRGKKVKLELTQPADGKRLYWRSIATLNKPPGDYVLKRVLDESGKGDMQVSRGLGLTLQSGGVRKPQVLEALEVYRLGGRVTFCNEVTGQLRYEYLYGVMIGRDWKGGDKTFDKLKDLKWVRNVLVGRDSGVSDAALARLQKAKGENFRGKMLERTPSAWGGMSCTLTVRNRTKKDVTVSRVHGWGGLSSSFVLKAGAEVKMHAHEGQRYETHVSPGDRNRSKSTAWTWINGDTVWEIK